MLLATESTSAKCVNTQRFFARESPAAEAHSLVEDGRYVVRFAENASEVLTALRLRHEVFGVELGRAHPDRAINVDLDAYDFKCRHLIVLSKETGETVGTYRLNSIGGTKDMSRLYSGTEFTIQDLPVAVLQDGIEIGRACIAAEHRNTRVLFLLWKALLRHLEDSGKRYYFGCCSIFSEDPAVGRAAFHKLRREGFRHERLAVQPYHAIDPGDDIDPHGTVELPALFNMYLRIGAKVCGPPMIDHEFGTIDFFVVFDVHDLNEKYRRLFSR